LSPVVSTEKPSTKERLAERAGGTKPVAVIPEAPKVGPAPAAVAPEAPAKPGNAITLEQTKAVSQMAQTIGGCDQFTGW